MTIFDIYPDTCSDWVRLKYMCRDASFILSAGIKMLIARPEYKLLIIPGLFLSPIYHEIVNPEIYESYCGGFHSKQEILPIVQRYFLINISIILSIIYRNSDFDSFVSDIARILVPMNEFYFTINGNSNILLLIIHLFIMRSRGWYNYYLLNHASRTEFQKEKNFVLYEIQSVIVVLAVAIWVYYYIRDP
jgi:hypothetical protein